LSVFLFFVFLSENSCFLDWNCVFLDLFRSWIPVKEELKKEDGVEAEANNELESVVEVIGFLENG
jgi:hypothetical protein